jgi:ABC-type sugar transport system permease subunit
VPEVARCRGGGLEAPHRALEIRLMFSPATRDRFWTWQHRYAPYLFMAPFIVLFCCFLIYPLGRSIILSFYKAVGPRNLRFEGLGNYRFIITDYLFWIAVANTVTYTVGFLSIQIPAALGLALLLNNPRTRFRAFFRFAFFTPHLVGQVFVAVIFALILAPRHGLLNRLIGALLPAVGSEINWFGDPRLAMPAVIIAALSEINWFGDPRLAMPAVIIAALWLSIGYGMIYFLAALQSVDRELYEAAEVDGAGPWMRFWHVTLPGIRPVLVFLVLVGTIGAFQLFELPYILFRPRVPPPTALTIVMYLFQTGFEQGDIGYASAVGWMLVLMIFAVSLLQLRVTGMLREEPR